MKPKPSERPDPAPGRPDKEQVRRWLLTRRRGAPQPLPELAAIRREVGWTAEPAIPSTIHSKPTPP